MTRRLARRTPRASGFTLVEVIVVLGVLAVGAAITLPAFTLPRETTRAFGQLVLDARRTAIARAQPLGLDVDASGFWRLVTVRDGTELSRGRVEDAPSQFATRFELSPFGACLLRSPVPREWASWDASHCTPLARAP